MKKIALSALLICIHFLQGCAPIDFLLNRNNSYEEPLFPDTPVEIQTEKAVQKPVAHKIDCNAVDFVGKTANEVFEILGKEHEVVGTESGAMQFICKSCPDMLFCVVPLDWSGVNGVEEIEYISPLNGAKANDFLKANMTLAEIETALSNMPDVQFSALDSYYTEMDDINVERYLIQTAEAEIVYEWYEKSSDEPADSLIVKEKEVVFNEDIYQEDYIVEIPTEIIEITEA